MKKEKRKVIVSRFETFTDVFRFEDCKSVGSLTINCIDKNINFMHEAGDVPTLYIILMIMSVNKTWLRIVEGVKIPADMNRYFLLTRWINFEESDFYLCHEENGVTVIDELLVRNCADGSIKMCALSPLVYLMLVEHDSRFSFSTPKSRLTELREVYDFRFIS